MPVDITCFNWVQLIKKSKLPSNAKLLGFYLATFMNAEHDVAWPSQSRISYETGLSEPTVRKFLQVLNDEGWLITKKSARHVNTGVQNYLHNEYLIAIPQTVTSLLSGGSRGKNEGDQGVNSERAEGKELTPNNNRITKNNKGRFSPPTREEVRSYASSRSSHVDPDKFFEYFQEGNWKDAKGNQVKNWKQKFLTWENKTTKQPTEKPIKYI